MGVQIIDGRDRRIVKKSGKSATVATSGYTPLFQVGTDKVAMVRTVSVTNHAGADAGADVVITDNADTVLHYLTARAQVLVDGGLLVLNDLNVTMEAGEKLQAAGSAAAISVHASYVEEEA